MSGLDYWFSAPPIKFVPVNQHLSHIAMFLWWIFPVSNPSIYGQMIMVHGYIVANLEERTRSSSGTSEIISATVINKENNSDDDIYTLVRTYRHM